MIDFDLCGFQPIKTSSCGSHVLSAPSALVRCHADVPRRSCVCLYPEYAAQRLHGCLEFIHRCRTSFGLATVTEHEKIVCNLRRNLGSDQAITAPAALPLVCDHAPAGVSRIATEHLLNLIEAKPDLSHGCLQTWFGSHVALCSLTAS